MGQKTTLALVDRDRNLRPFLSHVVQTGDVIHMGVRQKDHRWDEPARSYKIDQGLRREPGVHDPAGGAARMNHEAVGHPFAKTECLYLDSHEQ